jgi:hypothetical protein
METISLENDIRVFYVAASSFPAGIMEAFQKLHALAPRTEDRRFFGLSRSENGTVAYKAAAEETFEGEGQKLNCPTIVLKKGKYISETIHDFMNDGESIGNTFQKMIARPDIDSEGYCVELYLSDNDVQCMVRLAD